MTPTNDDLETTLGIHDPSLDRPAILDRIRQAIRHRQAAGGYGPDVTALGSEALRPTPLADNTADQTYTSLLRFQEALDQLAAQSHLREPRFHSGAPLVGPLIVAVRRLWNWMAAKWYVRGWMAQQEEFNVQAVGVIDELLQMHESNERRVHELELQLERLLRDEGSES